uniref:C2H2-type domain-containing protein n=1 Tax=Anas platyrhynchos TaxID=8839 RepID=A0A8B9SZ36_ANAPL
MDVKVDWGSESNSCDTGENQHPSPCCNSAGLPGKQELPAELQSEDKESYETCYQKRGESTAGVFVPSSTNLDLQCEDKDAGRCSSERHLRNVHKIERSMVILGNGMARNPWSIVHRNQQTVEYTDQPCAENHKAEEEDCKPYACPTCGKGFDKPNLLSKHKVIHRQEKPYKCQECGMAFVQLLRLKRHQQTHSGERPFYCEECGGTFTRLASLQRHQRIHTGEKPYSCDYCGHSFTESGTLRRHEPPVLCAPLCYWLNDC